MAIIAGTPGNDSIVGTHGDDVILGSAGNDTIIGGLGVDTVAYDGARADYAIDIRYVGFDYVTSAGKLDRLFEVERLSFADDVYAIALDIFVLAGYGSAGLACQLYHATLGRSSDPAGLGYWLAQLDSSASAAKAVALGFLGSAEYESLLGAAPTNDQFLEATYQNLFDRAPDQAGLAFWSDLLTSGALTREQVLLEIVNSDEAVATVVTPGDYLTGGLTAEYASGVAFEWWY